MTGMILTEWEIWYTYSTYLTGGVDDLTSAAKALVESGLAYCAMHRDGETYWKSNDGVRCGITEIEPNEKGTSATIRLKPFGSPEPDFASFSMEAWYQSAWLRYAEIRLFGEDFSAPAPYVRAFLGQCELINDDGNARRRVTCYPIVKIYESGVLIVEMRTISPSRSVKLNEFIDRYVNVHEQGFDMVGVPPALAKIAPRAYASYREPRKSAPDRLRLFSLEADHDEAITQLTEVMQSGDFVFEAAPLPSSFDSKKQETILSLALVIFEVISFAISQPRKALALLLRGQKKLIQRGGYWEGRPHVHIIRHRDQMDTAAENEQKHLESLNQIFLRTSARPGRGSARELPTSARLFGDYGAYIAPQAIVWIWAKQGIEAEREWKDLNRGHLVYANQACAEMLEYGYMLHRSLSEGIVSASTSRDVLRIRTSVLELRSRMRQSSHFGEIAQLLENGWKSMCLEDLRKDIAEGLAIRESETGAAEAKATEKIGQALTIVFGILAIPTLASDVITPLWDLFAIWRPVGPNAAKLFMIMIASVPVIALLFGASRWFRGHYAS